MTVAELIEFLKLVPRHLPVAYRRYSECAVLNAEDIVIEKHQPARPDGWIHDARPDRDSVDTLVFPGN